MLEAPIGIRIALAVALAVGPHCTCAHAAPSARPTGPRGDGAAAHGCCLARGAAERQPERAPQHDESCRHCGVAGADRAVHSASAPHVGPDAAAWVAIDGDLGRAEPADPLGRRRSPAATGAPPGAARPVLARSSILLI